MADMLHQVFAAPPARADDRARRAFLAKAAGVAGGAAVTLILAAGTKSARAEAISDQP